MADHPPNLLTLGVWEGIRALQREELRYTKDLRDLYAPLLRSFREELRRVFLGHFVLGKSIDGAPPVAGWDPLIAADPDLDFPDVTQLTTALVDESGDLIEEALDESMDEGHRRELWLLSMGGLDVEPYRDSLPEGDRRTALLLAAGVAGLSWRERLISAGQDHQSRVGRWLRASIRASHPVDDTVSVVERMGDQFVNRVTGLTGNEMFRAYGLGGSAALDAARQDHDITEVWITREDRIVCPLCAALHLTVTLKQPVTDSHPACRCGKVPVPAGFVPRARSYADFSKELAALEAD